MLNELTSRPLSSAEWISEAHRLIGYLRKLAPVCVYYFGVGAEMDVDDMWQPREVSVESLRHIFDESIDAEIVYPGGSDFFVEVKEPEVHLRFCRSSDIHVKSTRPEVLEDVRSSWQNDGLWYEVEKGKG